MSIHTANENNWIVTKLMHDAGEIDRAWIGMHSFEAFVWTNGDYAFIQNVTDPTKPVLNYPLGAVFVSAGGSTLGNSSAGNWYKDHSQQPYSSVCEKPFVGLFDALGSTTTEAIRTTTCAPFGSPAKCTSIQGFNQYGLVQPFQGICLVLRGINSTFDDVQTWTNANSQCNQIPNGALARLEDASKWSAVTNLAAIANATTGFGGVWVGLQRGTELRWTNGDKLTYVPNQSVLNPQVSKDCFALSSSTNDFNYTTCSDTTTILPYVCEVIACPAGMISLPDCSNSNYVCFEKNECVTGEANCGPSYSSACVDLPHDQGMYKCQCANGFQQTDPNNLKSACADIHECDNPSTCNQQLSGGVCIEEVGGYLCACKNGFRLQTNATDQASCVDVNECVEQPGICDSGTCINGFSNYTCLCPPGFQFKNGHCPDVNECALAINPCGLPSNQAFCHNLQGFTPDHPNGYVCACPPGYVFPVNQLYCQEINNCAASGGSFQPCGSDPNVECVNYQGSYYCACTAQRLFDSNSKQCVVPQTWPISYSDNGTNSITNFSYASNNKVGGASLLKWPLV